MPHSETSSVAREPGAQPLLNEDEVSSQPSESQPAAKSMSADIVPGASANSEAKGKVFNGEDGITHEAPANDGEATQQTAARSSSTFNSASVIPYNVHRYSATSIEDCQLEVFIRSRLQKGVLQVEKQVKTVVLCYVAFWQGCVDL